MHLAARRRRILGHKSHVPQLSCLLRGSAGHQIHKRGQRGKTIAHVYAPSTSELALMFRFAPEMRTTPSVDWSSDTTDLTYRYNSNNSQNFDRSNLNSDGSLGQVTPQGGAMWIAGWSHGQSSGDGGEVRVLGVTPEEFLFIQFDSEL